MKKELLKGEAKFQQLRNDLFWDCCLLSYDKNNGIEARVNTKAKKKGKRKK